MLKLVKYEMIVTNVVLGLLFVCSNLYVWNRVNTSLDAGMGSQWSAFQITLYPISMNAMSPAVPVNNFPFWLFWVTIAINMYFIIRLQNSKEAKS